MKKQILIAGSASVLLFSFQNCNSARFTPVDKFGVQSSSTSSFGSPDSTLPDSTQPPVAGTPEDPPVIVEPPPVVVEPPPIIVEPPPIIVEPPPVVIEPPKIIPPKDFDDCKQASESGKLIKKTYSIKFPDPKAMCEWGINGNASLNLSSIEASARLKIENDKLKANNENLKAANNKLKADTKALDKAKKDSNPNTAELEAAIAESNALIAKLNLSIADSKIIIANLNAQISESKSDKTKANGLITARREQYQKIALESTAKVCNVGLKNTNQDEIIYDDNMIMTLNNYVLASTTNFSQHFEFNDGLPKFSWNNLLNQAAQNGNGKDKDGNYDKDKDDTSPEKQFCLGKDQNLADCLFPTTEIKGSINLAFKDQVIQSILSKTSTTVVEIGLVTTGDNDPTTDCQHSDLTFDLEVQYIDQSSQQ